MCLCGPWSESQRKLYTQMRLIEPTEVIFSSRTKSFTGIGQIWRALGAPHFVGFLLFHYLYRRLYTPSRRGLSSGTQIIRTLPASWALVLKFQLCRKWLLISIVVVSFKPTIWLMCFENTGYRPLRSTLERSACCIQEVADCCFTVQVRGPWDPPWWVCLLHSVTVQSCWFLFYSTG